MSIHTHIRCPACHGPLAPIQLRCDACDLTLTGRFITNEFASLSLDDLHFLRIFVHCEGRIRDMESALGVSYPTIKSRLAQLKQALATRQDEPLPVGPPPESPADPTAAIIAGLQAGRLTFDQAMAQLKAVQKDDSHEE